MPRKFWAGHKASLRYFLHKMYEIEFTPEAFEDLKSFKISRSRLKHPVLSTSDVLKNGRNSFKKSDDKLLAWLFGINYAAVQRNQGIDAILEDDLWGRPILARFQSPGGLAATKAGNSWIRPSSCTR